MLTRNVSWLCYDSHQYGIKKEVFDFICIIFQLSILWIHFGISLTKSTKIRITTPAFPVSDFQFCWNYGQNYDYVYLCQLFSRYSANLATLGVCVVVFVVTQFNFTKFQVFDENSIKLTWNSDSATSNMCNSTPILSILVIFEATASKQRFTMESSWFWGRTNFDPTCT